MAAAAHFGKPVDFAMDPIYLDLIVDPVTDQCGHSFSRSTIDELVATVGPGKPVLCPFSRLPIDIDKLFDNHLAKEALDYCDQLENRARQLHEDLYYERRANDHGRQQIVKEFDHRLQIQRREFAHRFSLKQDELDYERKERAVESKTVNEKLDQLIKLSLSNKSDITRLNKKVEDLTRDLGKSRAENRRMHLAERRKSKNIREMTIQDKLLITFGECLRHPDHLQTVLDRGTKKV